MAEILKRAVQPVSGGLVPSRRAGGITLAELEAVASEAGIDPIRVREAALTLDQGPVSSRGSVLLGPRTTHVFDRVVDGEVPPPSASRISWPRSAA
jgi:hypothetical protein